MRFRLLTLIMIASVLLLLVKVADIIDRRQSLFEGFVVETLHAEEKKDEEKKDEEHGEKKSSEHGDAKEEEGHGGEEGSKEEKKEGDTASDEDAADTMAKEQEHTYTQIELDILQRLGDRRTKLEEWQKDLEVKENVLNITQTKIDQKIAELRELKTQVEAILAEYRKKEDEKTLTLVKIYENMKPKAAAKIFTELELPTLLQVVDKMKEKNVAAIVAEMDPKLAKELTETFAAHGRLPEPEAAAKPAAGAKPTPAPAAAAPVAAPSAAAQ